jgi:hypothetical protein
MGADVCPRGWRRILRPRAAGEVERAAPPVDQRSEPYTLKRARDGVKSPTKQTYSHSMVPGGFDVMSRTTRLTWRISLIMREATRSRRS